MRHRTRSLTLLAVLGLCTACRANPADWLQGRVTRWPLRGSGTGIGLITAVVRCGETLYLADFQSRVHAFDLTNGRVAATFTTEAPPFALAADCAHGILYMVAPQARRSPGTAVLAVDSHSGDVIRRYSLPMLLIRGAHFRPPESLDVVAIHHPNPEALFRATSAESFYRGTKIGIRLSLQSDTFEPLFDPYEPQCIGAGTCLEVSAAAAPDRTLIAQPTSARVGRYDASGRFERAIDIGSPGFRRTGQALEPDAPAEAKVRWNAENSVIGAVFAFDRHVAVVHHRATLGAGWVFGEPVDFAVSMNIYSDEGALVAGDVDVPDLAVGQDEQGVFFVDYGEHGRAGGGSDPQLWRLAID